MADDGPWPGGSRDAQEASVSVRAEMRPMLRVALPLVLAEVGWMLMGLVDTVMVGRLPEAARAMGAVALAQVLFNTMAFGVGGVLLGLDTTVAQAHGAGRYDEAGRWLVQGLYVTAAVAVGLTCVFLLVAPAGMLRMGSDVAMAREAVRTLEALTAGLLPLLVYFAVRRHLQAFNHVRVIAATLISANVVNVCFDWLLIFGHHWRVFGRDVGWTGMGPVGSGTATSLARVYQAGFLLVSLWWLNRRHGYGLERVSRRADRAMLRRLLGLGLPAGATILVEISVFALVTFLIGTLGAVPLAGHEVALNCVSFTFMVPLGLSAAASVRVGQAVGRGDAAGARAAGWSAVLLAAVFMSAMAAMYLLLPWWIARVFTPDEAVILATVPLLGVGAVFQLFDGLQISAIGALRGAGDTHSGLITHFCTYWLFGMPLGWWLCFRRGYGARGLWAGLCAALVVAGVVLLLRWRRVGQGLVARG